MQVKFARTILAGAAVAFGLAFATPSTASAQMGFVVQGNYADDLGLGAGAGIGFGLGSLTTNSGIRAEVTFDYYFDAADGFNFGFNDIDVTAFEINGNALMDIKSVPGLYVGAGAHFGSISISDCDACNTDSEIGLNLLGGWNFSGSKGPFVQAKFELGGFEQLVVTGGFRF
jgi:hypothetical protein